MTTHKTNESFIQRLRFSERIAKVDEKDEKEESLVEEFRSSATIHGISRIGDSSLYSFRWVIWIVLVCGMALTLGTFVGFEIWHYTTKPTLTKINANFRDYLEFPAVTICNLNQVKISILNCTDSRFLTEFFYRTSEMSAIKWDIFKTKWENKSISGSEILECVKQHSHSLDGMYLVCTWAGKKYKCSDLFKPVLTTYGICYTFNGNHSNPIVVNSGRDSVLRLILNIQQDSYFFSRTLQAGIKVNLHDVTEDPLPHWRGFLVGPGVSASAIITREKKKYLPPPYGNCLDTKASNFVTPLQRSTKYTRLTCELECYTNELFKRCRCRHFYYYGPERLCNADELLYCIVPNIQGILETENTVYRNCANSCRRSCDEVTYDASLSYALFSSLFVHRFLEHEGIIPENSSINQNLIDLKIFYDSLIDIEIEEVPELTMTQILGTLGGNMGLFLGASILSLVEIIEFCLLYCTKGKPRKQTRSKDESSGSDNNMNELQRMSSF